MSDRQLPMFDIKEGRRRRDRGMTGVVCSSDEQYKELFIAEGQRLMANDSEFTSEDIIEQIGMPPGHPSLIGALVRALGARWTGKVRQAQRPSCHAALLKVWTR